MPDAGVIGILIAHLGAFGSGELKRYIILFLITIHEKKTGRFYNLFNHFNSGQEKLELGSISFHPKL